MEMVLRNNVEKLNAEFLQVCRDALLQDQAYITDYCRDNFQFVVNGLRNALLEGICALHDLQEHKRKGRLAYLQFSFLMSGIFSNEHLLKIDFYDDRFYEDPYEIDCYWDYSCLFPEQSQRQGKMISEVRRKVVKVMDYELHERFPTYRLGQMQLLLDLLKRIQAEEKIVSLLSTEAEPEIKVIYGVYMGAAQMLFTVKKEQI